MVNRLKQSGGLNNPNTDNHYLPCIAEVSCFFIILSPLTIFVYIFIGLDGTYIGYRNVC